MTDHRIYLETYTMQTMDVKVVGLFTRVHAEPKSKGTFKQLLLQECTSLRESKIPFVIRASEFKANSEPEAAQRSWFSQCPVRQRMWSRYRITWTYIRRRKDIKTVFSPCKNGWDSCTKVNVLRQNNDWAKCYRRITLSGVKDLSTAMTVEVTAAPGGVVTMIIEEFFMQAVHHDSSFPLFKYLGVTLPKHTRMLTFTHPLTTARRNSGRKQPHAGHKMRHRSYYKEFQMSDTE
jgi:hypothetical protein